MVEAVAEVLEVADIFVFSQKLVEVGLGLRVLEFVTLKLAERLRETARACD